MNNFSIQKLIFFCLTFPYILIFSGDAYSSDPEKFLLISQRNRFSEYDDLSHSKIIRRNQLLSNLENSNTYNIQKKSKDNNSKTLVNELLIESKVQSEKDNILYADGDVVVTFKDNILKADSLTYNKNSKLAKAEGNIQLKIKNQIFQADIVEYDFIKKRGNFKNIKGLINSESIISDFDFQSNAIYEKFLSTFNNSAEKIQFVTLFGVKTTSFFFILWVVDKKFSYIVFERKSKSEIIDSELINPLIFLKLPFFLTKS